MRTYHTFISRADVCDFLDELEEHQYYIDELINWVEVFIETLNTILENNKDINKQI